MLKWFLQTGPDGDDSAIQEEIQKKILALKQEIAVMQFPKVQWCAYYITENSSRHLRRSFRSRLKLVKREAAQLCGRFMMVNFLKCDGAVPPNDQNKPT